MKYLLGATKDKEIVFAEFGVTTRNGYPEFTAGFDTVRPFREEDYDIVEYFEEYLGGLDKEYKYDLCERYDCCPSELAEQLADDCEDIRDAVDCSLYPEIITVQGENWFFESGSCGQHDTRKDGMDKYTNKEVYDKIHELWDKYHLKKVDEDVVKLVSDLQSQLLEIDEEEWITDYIKNNIIEE